MMEYAKSTRKIGIVTFELLLLIVVQTLGQTTITTNTKLPYSQWYTNRDVYKSTVFGFPPEERRQLNSIAYKYWIAEQERNWQDKCTVHPDVTKCTKTETSWYYNNQTQLCTTFNGCDTIKNSYKSKDECVQVCEQYSPNKPLPTAESVTTSKPVTEGISEIQTPNSPVTQLTTTTSVPVTEPTRYVTTGIPETVTPKKVQDPKNGICTCGHKLHKLAGVYLQQHAGVPRPISMHDNATLSTEHTIGITIDELAMRLFADCSLVNITRTKWLSTEVESTPDGGMFIYQVGIQTMTFVHP